MKSSKLIDAVCSYAEEALELPFTLYADMIPDEAGDGACVRCEPASSAARAFCDGSRLVEWKLAVYVRCAASEDAREWAKLIVDCFDGCYIEAEDETVLRCEALTLPQYINVDAKGATVYLASFSVEYLQG